MMIIDFEKASEDLKDKKVEMMLSGFEAKARRSLDLFDEILDDIEDSEINWFDVKEIHREKIEALSKTALFMETYVGWVRSE
tara:strand:- start:2055 stop:2300 length:246 start_codon:yes stop_codon:yes gene_type:complete